MSLGSALQYWERLRLPPEDLQQVAHAFKEQLEAGLENKSSLLMIPTMVDMLPQGYAHHVLSP